MFLPCPYAVILPCPTVVVSYYSYSRWNFPAVWVQVLLDYCSHDLLTWLYSELSTHQLLSHDHFVQLYSIDCDVHVFGQSSHTTSDTFSVNLGASTFHSNDYQMQNSFLPQRCPHASASYSASASHSILVYWLFFRFLVLPCMFGSLAWHAHLCLDRRRSAPVFWLLQLLFKYQWLPLL